MSIYLDYAATAPLRPEALQAMLPLLETPGGNPSAMYASARAAREALEQSRRTVARCIGARPEEIFFTSGGTESINWALQRLGRKGLVTTAAEHHAVLDVGRYLKETGSRVEVTGVRHPA